MENNKKQTAVEWVVKLLRKNGSPVPREFEEKAKEIEKEQNKKSFHVGRLYLGREGDTTFEQYYNETYGRQTED